MGVSTCLTFIFLALFGCSSVEKPPAIQGEPLGSGSEQNQPLTVTNFSLAVKESWDRTGVVEYSDSLLSYALESNRLSFRWWENARSDYFAYLQDPETGDTLKVLFEGATKKGLAEVSFNISALQVGQSYRWLLTRKAEQDTLQLLEYQIR